MRTWRLRYYGLLLAASGLSVLSGCVLSDQQLASIWQTVVTTALSTLVSGFASLIFPAATATAT